MSIYPITFSIPSSKIITHKHPKEKFLSSLIPGDYSTYIYNTEEDYYNEYRKSFFAITCKKAGWDCMRHYEIIANGCIPYFKDIEQCPPNTLYLFPKELIQKGNTLFEKALKESFMDINEYYEILDALLEYMHNHLTTKKMASYILSKFTFPISKILYLSGETSPDYLRCVTLHGFKELYGTNCHDYPKIPHLYYSNPSTDCLYGKGMSYSNVLCDSYHDNEKDLTIIEDIQNHVYDIIIYGSYHRGMPFYDIVKLNYKDNLIMLCTADIHSCDYSYWVNNGHTLFVREL